MESNNKIKDITLADWGRKEIELAEVEMPGLMACREEFGKRDLIQERKSPSMELASPALCT